MSDHTARPDPIARAVTLAEDLQRVCLHGPIPTETTFDLVNGVLALRAERDRLALEVQRYIADDERVNQVRLDVARSHMDAVHRAEAADQRVTELEAEVERHQEGRIEAMREAADLRAEVELVHECRTKTAELVGIERARADALAAVVDHMKRLTTKDDVWQYMASDEFRTLSDQPDSDGGDGR